MNRTSFMLPGDLKRVAQRAARKANISLAEFFRQAIFEKVHRTGAGEDFFDFTIVYKGPAPKDGSERPEKYRLKPGSRRA